MRRYAFFSRVIASVVSLIGPMAHAVTVVAPTTVLKVGIYSGTSGGAGAYVNISPAIPGLENCTHSAGDELWIDFTSTSEPTGKSLYATIMGGWLAGHSVTFEVSGCSSNGAIPLIYNVEIGL